MPRRRSTLRALPSSSRNSLEDPEDASHCLMSSVVSLVACGERSPIPESQGSYLERWLNAWRLLKRASRWFGRNPHGVQSRVLYKAARAQLTGVPVCFLQEAYLPEAICPSLSVGCLPVPGGEVACS